MTSVEGLIVTPVARAVRMWVVRECRFCFLAGWSAGPTRWSAGPTGRTFGPAGRTFGPAGRTFGSTRGSFGATTAGWFFIGRLCRFPAGRRRALLRAAARAEVGGFVWELRATVRTEVGGFIGELRAAARTEVGGFVCELRTAVRAKSLFFGTLLGQCGVPSLSTYLTLGH
jgi:hypothetical protein